MALKRESPRRYVKEEYPLSDVTARIIAATKEVHRTLGPGFEEVFYQRALAMELPGHDLEFEREVWIDVYYKGRKLGRKRVDFVIEEVMVEIKAKASLEDVDFAKIDQVNDMIATFIEFEKDTLLFYEMLDSFLDAEETRKTLNRIMAEENNHIKTLQELLGTKTIAASIK